MDVREKLVKQAISHFRHGVSHDIFSEPVTTYAKLAIEALEKEIDKAPTVDAVPVVRCKDCIHGYDASCGVCGAYCGYLDCVVLPEFYCADGERKENKNGVCNTLWPLWSNNQTGQFIIHKC